MTETTVRVDHDSRGWSIVVPDRPEPIVCDTLEDASALARLCASHRRPCELVVHDAYHRVLRREYVPLQN